MFGGRIDQQSINISINFAASIFACIVDAFCMEFDRMLKAFVEHLSVTFAKQRFNDCCNPYDVKCILLKFQVSQNLVHIDSNIGSHWFLLANIGSFGFQHWLTLAPTLVHIGSKPG